jgi:SAM-dependent methyltransferase
MNKTMMDYRRTVSSSIQELRGEGLSVVLKLVVSYFLGEKPIKDFDKIKVHFYKKSYLEVGGPSFIFSSKSILPIYKLLSNIDNVNFSDATVWGARRLNPLFPRRILRHQFITDATDLSNIKDGSYDCVISSHVLEHVANPLRALFEWKRILKTDGVLLLVLPHKQATFDHNRQITKLEHFILDYEKRN